MRLSLPYLSRPASRQAGDPSAARPADAARGARPLNVLASPAFSNRAGQPYNWLLYSHLRDRGVRVDEFSAARALARRGCLVHLHWSPTSRVRSPGLVSAVLRSAALVALLAWVRARGGRVVWTAHNAVAHDRAPRPRLERWFWRAFPGCLDAVLHMSASARDAVCDRYPALRGVRAFVVPHGHYRTAYPMELDRAGARRRLGVAARARVLAFVGQIRPYKNVAALLAAFAAIPDPDAVLLIAGEMKMGSEAESVRTAAAADPRVRLEEGFVPGGEMQIYLRAADLAVFPYSQVLNSGSALLALSFDRPVLVPARGSLSELARDMGADWVRTYTGELAPGVLAAALEWAVGTRRSPSPSMEHLDWARVAEQTHRIYTELLG